MIAWQQRAQYVYIGRNVKKKNSPKLHHYLKFRMMFCFGGIRYNAWAAGMCIRSQTQSTNHDIPCTQAFHTIRSILIFSILTLPLIYSPYTRPSETIPTNKASIERQKTAFPEILNIMNTNPGWNKYNRSKSCWSKSCLIKVVFDKHRSKSWRVNLPTEVNNMSSNSGWRVNYPLKSITRVQIPHIHVVIHGGQKEQKRTANVDQMCPNLLILCDSSGVPWVNALGGGGSGKVTPSEKVTNARERSDRLVIFGGKRGSGRKVSPLPG